MSTRTAVVATAATRVGNNLPNVCYGGELAASWNEMDGQQRATAISQLAFWSLLGVKDVARAGGLKSYYSARDVRAQLEAASVRAGKLGLSAARGAGDETPLEIPTAPRLGLRGLFAAQRMEGVAHPGNATFRRPVGE